MHILDVSKFMEQDQKTLEFIAKARKVHGDKFNYDYIEYFDCYTQVVIQCSIHGKYKQTPTKHITSYGCNSCALESRTRKKRLTTEEFVKRSKKKHGNLYDYSYVNYVDNETVVTINCKNHGTFTQSPHNHLQGRDVQNVWVKT